MIISSITKDYDHSLKLLSELLTRYRGEYIFRIGAHLPHSVLFSESTSASLSTSDQANEWTGVPKTSEEIDILCVTLTKAVEDIGGRVYFTSQNYFSGCFNLY